MAAEYYPICGKPNALGRLFPLVRGRGVVIVPQAVCSDVPGLLKLFDERGEVVGKRPVVATRDECRKGQPKQQITTLWNTPRREARYLAGCVAVNTPISFDPAYT